MRETLICLRVLLVTLALTGAVYPAVVSGIAHVIAADSATGSLITRDGEAVGSELVGQRTTHPAYLQPRPSAAGQGYDGTSSGGSNLGPSSRALRDRVAEEAARLRAENPDAPAAIPADLVTASGSGLDPHLTPAGALWQVPRIAKARGVLPERVRAVIEDHVEGRTLGFLGERRVNVLLVNLALDRQFGEPHALAP